MGKVFKATFTGGVCNECWDPIKKGEEVSYAADGNLYHAECNESSWDERDSDDDWSFNDLQLGDNW